MADLNAAQIAHVQAEINKGLAEAIAQMGIRRWAAEVAARTDSSNFLPLATQIYEFVTGDLPRSAMDGTHDH
jgi:hypothetical protein